MVYVIFYRNFILFLLECEPCSINCVKCISQNDCLECEVSYYLTKPNSCLEECPEKFFETSLGECQPCLNKCILCYDENSCEICVSPLVFLDAECKDCPSGKLESEGNCLDCPDNCVSCNNVGCLTCREPYIVSDCK